MKSVVHRFLADPQLVSGFFLAVIAADVLTIAESIYLYLSRFNAQLVYSLDMIVISLDVVLCVFGVPLYGCPFDVVSVVVELVAVQMIDYVASVHTRNKCFCYQPVNRSVVVLAVPQHNRQITVSVYLSFEAYVSTNRKDLTSVAHTVKSLKALDVLPNFHIFTFRPFRQSIL